MKDLLQIINEKLKIRKSKSIKINHIPKTISDLKYIVGEKIKNEDYDLRDIDVSNVLVFDYLFRDINRYEKNKIKSLNVTGWDVSKVENMYKMFSHSPFNGDISTWNLNNAKDIYGMFMYSTFDGRNGNIDNWDVSNVTEYGDVFKDSPLENNPPKWYRK